MQVQNIIKQSDRSQKADCRLFTRPSSPSHSCRQARRIPMIACKRDGRVRLFTRNGFDWSDRYPLIHAAVAALRVTSAVVDGEAVCCDEAGLAIFEKLHSRTYDDQAFLYAFDLLELDGEDWRPLPLEERKAKLQK